MNIYRQELRLLRRGTAIWTAAMAAVAAIYLGIYPGMAKDVGSFRQLLSGYPASVRAMLGVNLDTIGSLPGFYGMIFAFITLLGAIEAMNLGIDAVTRETRAHTADFLLAKPVSRAAIVTAKLLAALTALAATDLLYFAFASVLARAVAGGFSFRIFLLLNLTLLFVQLIFLALGMGTAVCFRTLKSPLPLSLGSVFGLYIAGALLATGKGKDTVRFFCPLQYFQPDYILAHGRYEMPYLLTGAALTAVGVAVAYLIYTRRDIPAVS